MNTELLDNYISILNTTLKYNPKEWLINMENNFENYLAEEVTIEEEIKEAYKDYIAARDKLSKLVQIAAKYV